MGNWRLDRSSEPYSDYGNLSGEGARRLLGSPRTDALLTAIRESAQNTWDARLEGTYPEWRLRIRRLSQEQLDILRSRVFSDLSPDPRSPLRSHLEEAELAVAEICDFGTHGLTGSTRPSEMTDTEQSRFVRFIRNIGAPRREGSNSGGTYGYGKSALFMLSGCQTILVDSLAAAPCGTPERRLIALRMGEEYFDEVTKRSYTGRHWWGRLAPGEDVVTPLCGGEAEHLAGALGLPERRSSGTGTSLMVIAPMLEVSRDKGDQLLVDYVHSALFRFFWPKMVEVTGASSPPMKFGIEVEGVDYSLPHIDSCPPYSLFAEALEAARAGEGRRALEIGSQRPKMHLGWLGYSKGPREARPPFLCREQGMEPPDPSHHIALMRPTELVVKYIEGPPMPNERHEWAGAFICSTKDEVESAFAASEPPTHDDWNPRSLPPRSLQKRFVNVALNRIVDRAKEIVPDHRGLTGGGDEPLASIADSLGGFLLSHEGGRAAIRPRPGRKGGASQKSIRVQDIEFTGLKQLRTGAVARFRFAVTGPIGARVIVHAAPVIIGEGGELLTSGPDGAAPQVVHWEFTDGDWNDTGPEAQARLPSPSVEAEVMISVPAGCAVRPRLQAREYKDD